MSVEEANTIANEMEARAFSKFFVTEQGLSEQEAQERTSLFLGNNEPVTDPKQTPQLSRMADDIRKNLDNGHTIEAIEADARNQPGFSQEAFDRAVDAVDSFIAEAPALPARIVTPVLRDIVEVSPELTEEDIIESIREADPELSEEEAVGFLETMSKIATKIDPFTFIGRFRTPVRKTIFGEEETQ